jgi:hypothetical protein
MYNLWKKNIYLEAHAIKNIIDHIGLIVGTIIAAIGSNISAFS